MPMTVNTATASLAATTWHHLRQGALRQALVVGALCLGITLILTAIDGRGFAIKLLYSVCIGVACTAIVQGTRLATAWVIDRTRRAGMPTGAQPLGWRGVVPGALLSVLLGPAAGLWLGDQFSGGHSASVFHLDAISTRLTLLFSVLATVIAVVVVSALDRLASARAQAEAAQRQAAEHQLRLLQSQLEPHMLFNTLANLRVLIGLDPAARAGHARPPDRLPARHAGSLARRTSTRWRAEFARFADYLALMAVRMGPRLQVQLDLPEALRRAAGAAAAAAAAGGKRHPPRAGAQGRGRPHRRAGTCATATACCCRCATPAWACAALPPPARPAPASARPRCASAWPPCTAPAPVCGCGQPTTPKAACSPACACRCRPHADPPA